MKNLILSMLLLSSPALFSAVCVERLSESIWRVRSEPDGGSLLNRYGILQSLPAASSGLGVEDLPVKVEIAAKPSGWTASLPLGTDTRVYGLGDVSRKGLNRRGGSYDLRVENVKSYIPIPMVMTSDGWGMLVNTTYESRFDGSHHRGVFP